MKTKITILILLITSIFFSGIIRAQTFSNPIIANGDSIVGSINSHPNDSLSVSMLNRGTALIGVTDVQSSYPYRNAVYGTNQEESDILFVNRRNTTYNFYERMRITRFGRIAMGTIAPDTSALLDIYDDHRGLLIPRIALTSVTDGVTIPLPAKSLLVWNNTLGGLSPEGYFYNAGNPGSPNWIQMATTMNWQLNGNAGTTPSTAPIGSTVNNNFIGTTDNKDFVMATNNLERVRVLAGGNVGIGTNSPLTRLTSNGCINILNENNLPISANGNGGLLLSGYNSTGTVIGRIYVGDGSGYSLRFSKRLSSVTTDLITIKDNGFLGVGTSNPQTQLHVVRNAATIRMEGTDHVYMEFYPDGPTTRKAWFGFQAFSDDNITLKNEITDADIILATTGNGNVGIATTNPAYKLDVNGDTRVTGHVGVNIAPNAGYDLYIQNSAYSVSGNWLGSDIRLKKDTSTYTDGLNLIKQIHPIMYRYNGKMGVTDTNQRYVSIIAQELQNIAPYAVRTHLERLNNPNDTTEAPVNVLGVNTQPLLFAAINAIKELAKKDSVKDSEIANLRAKDSVVSVQLQAQNANTQEMQNQMLQCCQQAPTKMFSKSSDNNVTDSLMREIDAMKKQMAQFSQMFEQCCSNYKNSSGVNSITQVENKDVPMLYQNTPNPFSENTVIKYYIPTNAQMAVITIKTTDGKELKKFIVEEKGNGQIIISGGALANGAYIYEMIIDSKLVGSYKMLLAK